MPPQTTFISGPLDPEAGYFEKFYLPKIDLAIKNGNSFVIGPMPGIDDMALKYLLSHDVPPSRITIHMAEFEHRMPQNRGKFEELGVGIHIDGNTTRERDSTMTKASDYDILRYRTEKECKEKYGSSWWPRVSSTEMNERRRAGNYSEKYITYEVKPEPDEPRAFRKIFGFLKRKEDKDSSIKDHE